MLIIINVFDPVFKNSELLKHLPFLTKNKARDDRQNISHLIPYQHKL